MVFVPVVFVVGLSVRGVVPVVATLVPCVFIGGVFVWCVLARWMSFICSVRARRVLCSIYVSFVVLLWAAVFWGNGFEGRSFVSIVSVASVRRADVVDGLWFA